MFKAGTMPANFAPSEYEGVVSDKEFGRALRAIHGRVLTRLTHNANGGFPYIAVKVGILDRIFYKIEGGF